jgi:hypothetical protein
MEHLLDSGQVRLSLKLQENAFPALHTSVPDKGDRHLFG